MSWTGNEGDARIQADLLKLYKELAPELYASQFNEYNWNQKDKRPLPEPGLTIENGAYKMYHNYGGMYVYLSVLQFPSCCGLGLMHGFVMPGGQTKFVHALLDYLFVNVFKARISAIAKNNRVIANLVIDKFGVKYQPDVWSWIESKKHKFLVVDVNQNTKNMIHTVEFAPYA